jgi:hypothetical protein
MFVSRSLPLAMAGMMTRGLALRAADDRPVEPSCASGTAIDLLQTLNRRTETVRAIDSLPAHIVGRLREPLACARTERGPYYLFDRRGHAVHTFNPTDQTFRTLVDIGSEDGKVLEPSGFSLAPDGSFAISDAPGGRARVQVIGPAGLRRHTFARPRTVVSRLRIGPLALGGAGSLHFTGERVIVSEPESGWLITELDLDGTPVRSLGRLRPTGQEHDPELHLALNAGMVCPDRAGGWWFVFLAGTPVVRRYEASGALAFERVLQGPELDAVLATQPQRWPRRSVEGREVPLVVPTVRAAATAPDGALWVSFVVPVTYVIAPDGEKSCTLAFDAAGPVAPTSLSFPSRDTVMVTPVCALFQIPSCARSA